MDIPLRGGVLYSYGNGEDWTPWIGKQWRWSYDYNLTLYAQWERTTFGNTVSHWLWGFKNGEGNNAAKTAYRINDDVPFYVAYKIFCFRF